ncbi:unnamed protein product [Lota lota]
MKLLVFWLLPSFLWALETPQMANTSLYPIDLELCQEDEPTLHQYHSSSGQKELVDDDFEDRVSCLLYPEKMLRCTMLGQYLPRGSQLSASVIIYDNERNSNTLLKCSSEEILTSEEPDEEKPVVVCQVDQPFLSLWVFLNISGRDTHLYCHKFSFELLELLSPPPNITAVVRKGLLLVSWGLPYSRFSKTAGCFHYQLEVNQQVNEIKSRNNVEMPVDPAAGHAVRMRTRKNPSCLGPQEWSAWSNTIALPPESRYNPNYVVIGSILLGTPMIILALLLLLRRPRVSKLLFPQIPQPPKKYKHFLKRPTSCSFLPVVQTACEDITVVEYTQSSIDELTHDL